MNEEVSGRCEESLRHVEERSLLLRESDGDVDASLSDSLDNDVPFRTVELESIVVVNLEVGTVADVAGCWSKRSVSS